MGEVEKSQSEQNKHEDVFGFKVPAKTINY